MKDLNDLIVVPLLIVFTIGAIIFVAQDGCQTKPQPPPKAEVQTNERAPASQPGTKEINYD